MCYRCDICGAPVHADPQDERICIVRESLREKNKEQSGVLKVYKGIGPEKGKIVEIEEAFKYALERCLNGTEEDKQEFKEMLVEWFYSGNWLEEGLNA